jgi:hypothetical protein
VLRLTLANDARWGNLTSFLPLRDFQGNANFGSYRDQLSLLLVTIVLTTIVAAIDELQKVVA